MEADVKTIGKVLTGDEKFFIPSYQRPYCWEPDNAEALLEDVWESCKSGEKEYFIGSIICIPREDGYEVVDGQQRLVTLTLIMAIMGRLEDKCDEMIRSDMKNRIFRIDPYANRREPSPTLTVRKAEHDFYLKRVLQDKNNQPETDPQKVFVANQKRIREFLGEKSEEELKKFAGYLLRNVLVLSAGANDRASSFRLFNVLNNRGMPLNDADLIKNLLLEKVAADKTASAQVEKNWGDIEECVGVEGLDKFLSVHQISEKTDRDRAKKKNFLYYESMLSETGKFHGNAIGMSGMLLHSARNYQAIWEGSLGNNASKKSVFFLRQVSQKNFGEWMPAFLAFHNRGGWNDQFPQFARLFEKVYMHHWWMQFSKSRREAASYYAIEAINKGEAFDKVMASVRSLANNAGFERTLDEDFYDGTRPQIINLVKAVLLRLDREEYDDSVEMTYSRKISVEHILPQDGSNAYWCERFNEKERAHWLHKLGNLTIVSIRKNSSARNLGFDEKKAAYQKSRQCPFGITNRLCDLPDWTPAAIEKRHEKLKALAKDLWLVEELV